MGYSGRYDDKLKAQELRRNGLSYGEILTQIKVSKDTISRWCKDIELSPAQKERLISNKKLGQHKASLIAADNKRQLRINRTQEIYRQTLKDLGPLSKRDRFVIGIALYAAEGDKSIYKGGFTNSDPNTIKFMVLWLKEFCHLPPDKFRGAIWIHEGNDKDAAKMYWSVLTGIPEYQFHKTYVSENKVSSKKIRKNIHPHGVFAIRFSGSETQRKILGWISAMLGDKIPPVH